jgi:predicted GTPase
MKRIVGPRRSLWFAAIALGALPFAALVPLGVLWLWQQGDLGIWFLGGSVCFVGAGLLFRRAARPEPRMDGVEGSADTPPEPEWTPADKIAWQRVQGFARRATGAMLMDQHAMIATASAVMEDVARHYWPDRAEAVWHFTLPEALLLAERVSRRTRTLTIEAVPGSRSIRIGDVMQAYRVKQTVTAAAGIFGGPWRIGRMTLNPMQALAAELNQRVRGYAAAGLSSLMLDRIARIVIEEVGREAINLYSGRLRADLDELMAVKPEEVAPQGAALSPLRILIGGKVNAGKSSLVNALCGEVVAAVDVLPVGDVATSHAVGGTGDRPELELIDCVGLDREGAIPKLTGMAAACDLIVWVVAANDGARDLDRRLIDAVRAHFTANPHLKAPPLLIALSHTDRLRPFNEWEPPYDIAAPAGRKAEAIRGAVDATAEALGVGVEDIVPVRLDTGALYNIDALWAAIVARLPDARQGQLVRLLRLAAKGGGIAEVARQAVKGGRLLSGLVIDGIAGR